MKQRSFVQYLTELAEPSDLTVLNKHLNDLFSPMRLNVTFTRHFGEHLFGRDKDVSVQEIYSAMAKLKAKYRKRLMKGKMNSDNYKVILKDFEHDLNIVFRIQRTEMPMISIMRKDPRKYGTDSEGGDVLTVQ